MISACCTAMLSSSAAEIELHIDLVAGGTQAIEAAVGDFFGDKDPRHRPPSLPPAPRFEMTLNDLFTWLPRRRPANLSRRLQKKVEGSMPYPFLSTEWMDAAKAIREKYADQASPITVSVRMNQVITDVAVRRTATSSCTSTRRRARS